MKADYLFCQSPHYFWALVLMNRLSFNYFKPKRTAAFFFHSDPFATKHRLLLKAPEGYSGFFVVQKQVDELIQKYPRLRGRIGHLPWKIDTDWFQPGKKPVCAHVLCAGNVQRDENLVFRLAGKLGLPLIRAGRTPILADHYRALKDAPDIFRLELNLDHVRYLDLLQTAACVILPIRDCDEPAGLTAALEAIACGVPVVANDSYGITPLLEMAYGEPPSFFGSDEKWVEEIRKKIRLKEEQPDRILRARDYVVKHHSILDPWRDWQAIFDGNSQ